MELLKSTRDSGGARGVVPEYRVRCSGAGCEYRFTLPDATTDASIDMGSRCACGGSLSDPTYKLSLRVRRPPPRFAHFRECVVCVFCDRDLRDYVAMMRDAPAGPSTRTTRPSPVQSPMTSPAREPPGGRGGAGGRAAGGRGSKRSRTAGSGAGGAASKRGAGARGAGGRGGGGGRAGAKCYKCQGMGHWAAECPRG